MVIITRVSGAVTVVKLDGMMTVDDGATEFRDTIRTLLGDGGRQIVLNYDLVYADSAGMAEFKKASFVARELGATIKIVVPKTIGWAGFLDQIMLLTRFDVCEDEEQATAGFGGDQS